VARRPPEQDFRLEAVLDVEARHNQHGGGVREARIVWGWQGIAAEGVDGWTVARARRGGCAYGTDARSRALERTGAARCIEDDERVPVGGAAAADGGRGMRRRGGERSRGRARPTRPTCRHRFFRQCCGCRRCLRSASDGQGVTTD
jgi:hypothetical protein